MTGPQGRPMGRRGRRRIAQIPRRARFITPDMTPPVRWHIHHTKGGELLIVDEDGVPVLDHPDPVLRRFHRHKAKAAPVYEFALVHAYRFITNLELPSFSDWIVTLIAQALGEGFPRVEVPGASALGNTEITSTEVQDGEESKEAA